jgi:hypothetical protein
LAGDIRSDIEPHPIHGFSFTWISGSIVIAGFQASAFRQRRMTGFQAGLPPGQGNSEAQKQFFVR